VWSPVDLVCQYFESVTTVARVMGGVLEANEEFR
jgi:hypothetical protein